MHLPNGQGLVSCIKKNSFNKLSMKKETYKNSNSAHQNDILCHFIQLESSDKIINICNTYIPFSCRALPPDYINRLSDCDLIVGDLNVYYNMPKIPREEQIVNIDRLTNNTDFNSFKLVEDGKVGPDLVLTNVDSPLVVDIEKCEFIGDHASLMVKCDVFGGGDHCSNVACDVVNKIK